MHADDGAKIARRKPGGDRGGIGRFAPGNVEPIDARPHDFGDVDKAFAELPIRQHQNVTAGLEHIGERRLHRAGPRRAEQQNVAPRAEGAPQRRLAFCKHRTKFRAAMVEHRLGGGGAYALGDRRGPGQAQTIAGRHDGAHDWRRWVDVHG